ncbi:hypothetical protein MEQU1_001517 [Malassezia equina]|uniref:Dynein light intermediate chain n=1 Tax=Malassezia equina TaxID=1381935 RepID=A0AAF0J3B5_9BASI|nr:hypothetical protein MEQU1_001517 [Malassezia equina]
MAKDLWGSLLRGARARYAFVSKTLVLLGEPGSGKSTLLRQLAGSANARASVPKESSGPLSFGYLELNEDPHAEGICVVCLQPECLRTGVYTVHSADASVTATLPYAFPPVEMAADATAVAALRRLRESLFVITLDASQPWTIVPQLVAWLALLQRLVSQAHASGCDADADTVRAAMREHIEELFRGSSDMRMADNLGVPLVFVLTKADTAEALVAEQKMSEVQWDYLQQALRTVALRFGAAIFATTQSRASSYDGIRAFIRHTLYANVELPGVSIPACDAEPVTTDLARLLIPPGWDSWAKIEAVQESFSCATWSEAFVRDMARTAPGAPSEADELPLASQMARERVPAPDNAADDEAPSVEVPSHEAFLESIPMPARDAGDTPRLSMETIRTPVRNALGPSMHASTLDMPAVGRAMEEQAKDVPVPAAPGTPGGVSIRHDDLRSPSVTTPKQTEVLHSFFQSLLKKPASPGSAPHTPSARLQQRARRRKEEGGM